MRLATATTDSGASRASRTNPRNQTRCHRRGQPPLRDGKRLQTRKRSLSTGGAADVGNGVGKIGEVVSSVSPDSGHAHPPKQTGIPGPALTKASSREPACRVDRDRRPPRRGIARPTIAERDPQCVALADQMMQARNRAVLLRLDDLKLRAAPWAHGSVKSETRGDRCRKRFAHIEIVGDRQHDARMRAASRADAGGDQAPGMDQHARGGAFFQSVSAQVARAQRDITSRRAVFGSVPDSRLTISASRSGAG